MKSDSAEIRLYESCLFIFTEIDIVVNIYSRSLGLESDNDVSIIKQSLRTREKNDNQYIFDAFHRRSPRISYCNVRDDVTEDKSLERRRVFCTQRVGPFLGWKCQVPLPQLISKVHVDNNSGERLTKRETNRYLNIFRNDTGDLRSSTLELRKSSFDLTIQILFDALTSTSVLKDGQIF